jgi:hypothetical protein
MKKDFNFAGLTPEAIATLQELRKKENSGEKIEPQTLEALKAVDLASKVVNTIMSGNQIDPVFFKEISDFTQKKILNVSGIKPEKKSVVKKKKLKRK